MPPAITSTRRAASSKWPARSISRENYESLQMFIPIRDKILIQGRDRALQKPPHRLAHIGGKPHLPEASRVIEAHFAEVDIQQSRLLALIEFMVRRQIAEIEKTIAHARILPINDSHGRPIEDEIACQE